MDLEALNSHQLSMNNQIRLISDHVREIRNRLVAYDLVSSAAVGPAGDGPLLHRLTEAANVQSDLLTELTDSLHQLEVELFAGSPAPSGGKR